MSYLEMSRARVIGQGWPALVLVALIGVAGCSGDSDNPVAPAATNQLVNLDAIPLDRDWAPGLVRSGYPFPADADQCVANVMDAYGERQLDPYRRMLNIDFQFVLLPEVVEQYGLPDAFFDLKEESGSAWRLLTGQPSDETGRAVSSIAVDAYVPNGAWTPVEASDPYFGGVEGAMVRDYDVRLRFQTTGPMYQVDGVVTYCVVPVEVEVGGVMRTAYQLRGQIDHTGTPVARESTSWSMIKVLYRLSDPAS